MASRRASEARSRSKDSAVLSAPSLARQDATGLGEVGPQHSKRRPNSTGDMGRGYGRSVCPVLRGGILEPAPSAFFSFNSDLRNKRPEEYDIEAPIGNEKEYIEMDLLLGVADLHSEKAVEVAEATMNGFPPAGRSFTCSSSDSEDDSDDSDEDGGDEQNMLPKMKMKQRLKHQKERSPINDSKIIVLN
uniref:Uncharacterized protein n=1 Tax=Oryza brachyantha TaxID=4533 RepID=J3NDJ2_ORYBR